MHRNVYTAGLTVATTTIAALLQDKGSVTAYSGHSAVHAAMDTFGSSSTMDFVASTPQASMFAFAD
jgi:hypothetical protein